MCEENFNDWREWWSLFGGSWSSYGSDRSKFLGGIEGKIIA